MTATRSGTPPEGPSGSPPALRVRDGAAEPLPRLPDGPPPQGAWDWIELDLADPAAACRLARRGLAEQVVKGLLDRRTRPRLARTPEGLLVILRVAGARARTDPEGLGSLRVWVSDHGIVVVRPAPSPPLAEIERVAHRSLQLTVAATTFLPATLLTGPLGVNVAGIPGAETPGAFWRVASLCLALALLPLALFLVRRWF